MFLLASEDVLTRNYWKCGISVPIDGTVDDKIDISSLPNYSVEGGEESEDAVDDESDPFNDDEYLTMK